MRLRWTLPAAEDLEDIKNYLVSHYPDFAEVTVRTIYQRVGTLKSSPNRGRPATVTVPGNCRLHRFPTSWFTP